MVMLVEEDGKTVFELTVASSIVPSISSIVVEVVSGVEGSGSGV